MIDLNIKVFLHSSIKATIDDDFIKCHQYFIKNNINTTFYFEKTIVDKQDALLNLIQPQSGKYDVCMYIYDRNAFQMYSAGLTFKVSSNLIGIYISTTTQDDAVNATWAMLSHELMHTLFMKLVGTNGNSPMDATPVNGILMPYYKNDFPDAPDGNFAIAWKILQPYLKTSYKYFKDSEVVGLKPEFVALLDKARDIAGVPFKITSGLRSVSTNESVGGIPDSSHLSGLAVDLAVADGMSGGKILLALVQVGLNRFGFYNDGHLHVDYDLSKPNPCYWVK